MGLQTEKRQRAPEVLLFVGLYEEMGEGKMSDLISRQAAIDAIYKCMDIYINNLPVMVDKADAYTALANLPSVQPEFTDSEIQKIQELEQAQIKKAYELGFEEGEESVRRELWEDEQDRLD